jgi:hypothetical protein
MNWSVESEASSVLLIQRCLLKGPVSEWPGASLQKKSCRFESGRGLGNVWHMHDRRDTERRQQPLRLCLSMVACWARYASEKLRRPRARDVRWLAGHTLAGGSQCLPWLRGLPSPCWRRFFQFVSGYLRCRARRSRSVMPPQTPYSIRLSSASTRHSRFTGQPLQTRLAWFCAAPITNISSRLRSRQFLDSVQFFLAHVVSINSPWRPLSPHGSLSARDTANYPRMLDPNLKILTGFRQKS